MSTATDSKQDSGSFNGRTINQRVLSREQAEGVGARVRRSIGSAKIRNFDPFLLLDEFDLRPPAGFPDHPHRGFETVTYILPTSEGTVMHEDFAGHSGTIGPGDVQWMTAGKGIVHAEMPGNGKPVQGLQLWVNLSSKEKLVDAAYQELVAKDIPKVEKDGIKVAVIAGEALGTKANIFTRTATHYLHYEMKPNTVLHHKLDAGWNCLVYTLSGTGFVGPNASAHNESDRVEAHYSIVMDKGKDASGAEFDGVTIATGDKPFAFVLLAGKPLNEEIVQYGPFVMNSMPEIAKAMRDYQSASNGFERAKGWKSKIGNKFGTRDGDYDDDD